MKSSKQLESEYCVKTKALSYWARIVKPSCEDCRKNDHCELLSELNRTNEELANLKQRWDTWEAPKFVTPSIFNFTDITQNDKMLEETRNLAKREKERTAMDLFKRKSKIEDKITSCKNKRVYAAIKLNARCFHSQDRWNIARCNLCSLYDQVIGVCTVLGIFHPKYPRICKYYDGPSGDDIKHM